MPTISQLPPANSITPADIVPLSQNGIACSVNVGSLLSGTQPAIIIPPTSLVGRASIGPGGPEQIAIGTGLNLVDGSLSANGGDHANFPPQQTFGITDSLVISSNGSPKLLAITSLRSLFSAGSNVAISLDGIVSASCTQPSTEGHYVTGLPVVADLSAHDLIFASQNGNDSAVSVENLINGNSIADLSLAEPATDSDMILVAQSGSILARQNLSAIWTWCLSKLASYSMPVVELMSDTEISIGSHNRRLVICSEPLTITANSDDLKVGFQCIVVNVSTGNIVLLGNFKTSSGASTLLPGQSMNILSASYSRGGLLYASIGISSPSAYAPGQATDLTVTGSTSDSITLTWTTPVAGGPNLCYTVLSRPTGSGIWSEVAAGLSTTQVVISSLSVATSYDIVVIATNDGASGLPSSICTASTDGSVNSVSPPTDLMCSNTTSSSISIVWSESSGSVQAYNVQYRNTGSASWINGIQATTLTNYTVTGLSAAQSYDWQVIVTGSDGSTATSSILSCSTTSVLASVNSIVWNDVPGGPVQHGNGALGVNAHVSPSTASVRFGISSSMTAPPLDWIEGSVVNSDLWGAYIPTPAAAGLWYVWCEGTDGSSPTFYPIGITIT